MDPNRIEAVLDQANDLLRAGRPADVLSCLRQIENDLAEGDERIECASLQAWALSELSRTDDALDMLESLIDEYPHSARLYSTLGVVLSNSDDLDGACEALEQAVALDEDDEVALANLGLVYEKLRHYEDALDFYDQAIERGAEIDWLLQRKAAVQAELGDLTAARATLKRYLSLAPDDAEQWVTLALLHSDEGQFKQAFQCYRAAEQIAPDSSSLRLNWGVTAVRAHQVDVARQQLQYLSRLEPESSRPLLLEASINEETGGLEAAAQAYGGALARARRGDHTELSYALEMSMDFFARHGNAAACERLFEQAYHANACTVELCEAYREATGVLAEEATWYSLIAEADYRPGLEEVAEFGADGIQLADRFLRNYQVIARNHDEALGLVGQLAERMGESNVVVREFVNEEPVGDAYVGLYEIERESLVFGVGDPERPWPS